MIASHRILWDAIIYPCLRYLFLAPKSSIGIEVLGETIHKATMYSLGSIPFKDAISESHRTWYRKNSLTKKQQQQKQLISSINKLFLKNTFGAQLWVGRFLFRRRFINWFYCIYTTTIYVQHSPYRYAYDIVWLSNTYRKPRRKYWKWQFEQCIVTLIALKYSG